MRVPQTLIGAVAIVQAAGVAAGCSGDPQPLGWEIRFDNPMLLVETVAVQARIRQGGCAGRVAFSDDVLRSDILAGTERPVPPVLEAGVYGFEGLARNDTCVVFAGGCQAVDLPLTGPVVVMVAARPETPACRADRCDSGACTRPPPGGESCEEEESECADNRDDDCDGLTDCADDECINASACADCLRLSNQCNPCNTCRDGACGAAPEGEACVQNGLGRCYNGICCSGCWDGSMCQPGDVDSACGRGGGACNQCAGTTTCQNGLCRAT